MEEAEDNEADNTFMTGLDIVADAAIDALSEVLEDSVEDKVQSYLSVDGGNSTLTSDN